MKASKLADILSGVNPDLEVGVFYDGSNRGALDAIYLTKTDAVLVAFWSESSHYKEEVVNDGGVIIYEAQKCNE